MTGRSESRGAGRARRRSIRLQGYDYSREGAYFVTVCTQDRACLFGDVVDGVMRVNDAGRMVQDVWDGLAVRYPGVGTDAFVVMPNHIHGVVLLGQAQGPVGQAQGPAPTMVTRVVSVGTTPRGCPAAGMTGKPMSLPDVVHRFKSLTTARYRNGVVHHGWPTFPGRLWQRNYYEQIVRDQESLARVRAYVRANPVRWATDRDNPNPIHGIERRPNHD